MEILFFFAGMILYRVVKDAKERKNIPWEALLREDSMALGKKSLRSIIAPWKSRED
mgnify:CR=1 FL=1